MSTAQGVLEIDVSRMGACVREGACLTYDARLVLAHTPCVWLSAGVTLEEINNCNAHKPSRWT